MNRLGIDLQIVSMSPSLTQYRTDPKTATACSQEVNDEWAALSKSWPGKISGFAALPLQDTDAAITELERAVASLGLPGACLPTHVNGENWDEDRLVPILGAAEALGALIFFHPMQVRVRDLVPRHHLRNLLGNPWETSVTIGSLIFGGVLDKHPDLRAIFAHGGGFAPYAVGRFDHGYHARTDTRGGSSLPSGYLKHLTYDCITHSAPALRYLLDTVGAENVVLGTDYPADMGAADPVKWITDAEGLSGDEKDSILSRNGERILAKLGTG
jgi:aminocarboxymuconate-semialdehyde decarboxylase